MREDERGSSGGNQVFAPRRIALNVRACGVLSALVVVLGVLLLPSAAFAGFGPPITVTPSGADAFSQPANIGFDQSGAVTVETVSGGHVLIYTRPASGSFSGGSIGNGSQASMAVSANGRAVVVRRESATSVKVAYRASPGGAFTDVASFPGAAVGNVAAGIDASGNAVVAWKDGSIRYALSTVATFGGAQDAPLGANPDFNGRGGDPQRDHGPRVFRDNAGSLVFAYRDGASAIVAHRSPLGTWDSATLGGGTATDLQADADPTSQRLIVGYTTSGAFQAFEGSTTSSSGSVVVNQPASTQNIMSVAVRRGGAEDLALWRGQDNALHSAGCLEGFTPTTVASSVGGGVVGAITSGHDEVAYYPGPDPGLDRSSRSPGGSWTTTPFTPPPNYGTLAAGAGYNGDALGAFVDYPNDTGITGFPYSGAAAASGACSSSVNGKHPTATSVKCDLSVSTNTDTCTATVGDSGAPPRTTPTGSVSFTSVGGGVFTAGSSCTLSPTPSSPGVASCSVQFIPPAGGLPAITGTYGGDSSHAGSSGSTQPGAGRRRPTGTSVMCNLDTLTATDTCTAQVGDGGAPPRSTPGGSVAFTKDTGGFFSFGNRCALRQTSGSPGVSSCSVQFVPSATGGFPQIAATYGGDATHAPSSGHTQFIIAAAPGHACGCSSCSAQSRDTGPDPRARVASATQSEKLKYTCYAAGLSIGSGSTSLAGLLAAATCTGYAPEFVTLCVYLNQAAQGISGAQAAAAGYYALLAADPPRRDFTRIAAVQVRRPRFPRARGRYAALERRAGTVIGLEARLVATFRALDVSRDRASGAHLARRRIWERRQILATVGLARSAAVMLSALARQSASLARAVRATKFGKPLFGVAAVRRSVVGVAKRGLPSRLVRALRAFGVDDASLRRIDRAALGLVPARAFRSFPAALGSAKLLAMYRAEAGLLRAYARRAAHNPSARQV